MVGEAYAVLRCLPPPAFLQEPQAVFTTRILAASGQTKEFATTHPATHPLCSHHSQTGGMVMAEDNPSILSHVRLEPTSSKKRGASTRNFSPHSTAASSWNIRVLSLLAKHIPNSGCTRPSMASPQPWAMAPISVSLPPARRKWMHSTQQPSPPEHHPMANQAAANTTAPPYYGCFVRDLDGNKIEATYWDMELGKELGMGEWRQISCRDVFYSFSFKFT
jgi:hypothetical protein